MEIGDTSHIFYHLDPLGSPVVITNSSGNALQRYHYYPFGGISSHTGSLANTHKFTGKELDSETGLGLYYFGARYYDPGIGRFITPDPVPLIPDLEILGNPHALNKYVYCLNNPIRYIDPTGLFTELVVTNANPTGGKYGWTLVIYKDGVKVGTYSVSRLSTVNPKPTGDPYGTDAEAPPGTYYVMGHPRSGRPVLGDEPGGYSGLFWGQGVF